LYDLNQVIFLLKKSLDLNRDLNQWFKSPWFKSANPDNFELTGDPFKLIKPYNLCSLL